MREKGWINRGKGMEIQRRGEKGKEMEGKRKETEEEVR